MRTVSTIWADGLQVIFQPYAEAPRDPVFHPEQFVVGLRTVRQMVRCLEPTVHFIQIGWSVFTHLLPLHLTINNPPMYYMSSLFYHSFVMLKQAFSYHLHITLKSFMA